MGPRFDTIHDSCHEASEPGRSVPNRTDFLPISPSYRDSRIGVHRKALTYRLTITQWNINSRTKDEVKWTNCKILIIHPDRWADLCARCRTSVLMKSHLFWPTNWMPPSLPMQFVLPLFIYRLNTRPLDHMYTNNTFIHGPHFTLGGMDGN